MPPAERVQATPLVRRIAAELGVDLATVTATGPGGRVTEEDVRGAGGVAEGRREQVRGVRRQIVEHLARSHREVRAREMVDDLAPDAARLLVLGDTAADGHFGEAATGAGRGHGREVDPELRGDPERRRLDAGSASSWSS